MEDILKLYLKSLRDFKRRIPVSSSYSKYSIITFNPSSILLSKITGIPVTTRENSNRYILINEGENIETLDLMSNHLGILVIAAKFFRRKGFLLNIPNWSHYDKFYVQIDLPQFSNFKDYEFTISSISEFLSLLLKLKIHIEHDCQFCSEDLPEPVLQNFLVYPRMCEEHFQELNIATIKNFYMSPIESFEWQVDNPFHRKRKRTEENLIYFLGLRPFRFHGSSISKTCIFCGKETRAFFSPGICSDCFYSGKYKYERFEIHYMNKLISWKEFFNGKFKNYIDN